MKTTFIYGLACPDTGEVRYIGKSDWPKRRLIQHCSPSEWACGTRKANWIKSLAAAGKRPRLVVLSEVPVDDWQMEEKFLIASFRMVGARLTNGTDGGDGVLATPEVRAKMSAAASNPSPETRAKRSHAARNRSVETLQKMADAARARPRSDAEIERITNLAKLRKPEHIAKMAAALTGKTLSAEAIAKRTASVLGSKRSDETRARMAAAQTGKKASDETRAKLSEAHKGRTLPPEQKARMAEAQRQRWARIKAAAQNQACPAAPGGLGAPAAFLDSP